MKLLGIRGNEVFPVLQLLYPGNLKRIILLWKIIYLNNFKGSAKLFASM